MVHDNLGQNEWMINHFSGLFTHVVMNLLSATQGSHATGKTGKVREIEYWAPGPGKVLKLDKCVQSPGKVLEKKHIPSRISNPNDNNNQLDSVQFGVRRRPFAFWRSLFGNVTTAELRL